MRRFTVLALVLLIIAGLGAGCKEETERVDRELVREQQAHYQKVHPLPFFEYSIPRDVLIQIYEVVVTRAYTTYTVIESITGETKFHGPSIGYGLPVDTQLTNPLQREYGGSGSVAIEQAEPSGVFSSKNTDGTWVLFVMPDGKVTPIYTEHKVTTFPFPVIRTDEGWVRDADHEIEFTVDVGN